MDDGAGAINTIITTGQEWTNNAVNNAREQGANFMAGYENKQLDVPVDEYGMALYGFEPTAAQNAGEFMHNASKYVKDKFKEGLDKGKTTFNEVEEKTNEVYNNLQYK